MSLNFKFQNNVSADKFRVNDVHTQNPQSFQFNSSYRPLPVISRAMFSKFYLTAEGRVWFSVEPCDQWFYLTDEGRVGLSAVLRIRTGIQFAL
jgi:hypothetical protein